MFEKLIWVKDEHPENIELILTTCDESNLDKSIELIYLEFISSFIEKNYSYLYYCL